MLQNKDSTSGHTPLEQIAIRDSKRQRLEGVDRILGTALNTLFGFSEEQATRVVDAAESKIEKPIIEALKELFRSSPKTLKKNLAAAEKVVDEFEHLLSVIRGFSEIQTIMDGEKREEDFMAAMLDGGAGFSELTPADWDGERPDPPRPPASNWTYLDDWRSHDPELHHQTMMIEGGFMIMRLLNNVIPYLNEFPDNRHTPLRTFFKTLKDIHTNLGDDIAKRYVEHFIEQCIGFDAFLRMFKGKMDNFSNRVAQAVATSDCVTEVCKLLEPVTAAYSKLGELNALKLYALIPEKEMDLPARMHRYLKKLPERRHIRDLEQFLKKTPEEQRIELLILACENPTVLNVGRAVRKGDIEDNQYAEFLLSHGHLLTGSQFEGETLLTLVSDLSKESRFIKNAACLVQHGAQLLEDPNWPVLRELARTYEGAHLLIDRYIQFGEEKETNKQLACIAIGRERPNSAESKLARHRLNELEDHELSWIADHMDDDTALSRLIKQSPHDGKDKDPHTRYQNNRPWFSLMADDLMHRSLVSAQGIDSLRGIHAGSPVLIQNRIRNVWRTQPETMETFADHLTRYRGTPVLDIIIKGGLLFERYKRALAEEDINELEELLSLDENNSFLKLKEWLYSDLGDESPGIPTPPIEEDEFLEREPKRHYDRIIVWGGQYKGEKREKISGCISGSEIEIIDLFTRQSADKQIRTGDFVIWVTTSNDHNKCSYTMRNKCVKADAVFVKFTRSGHKPLMDFIQDSVLQ